MRRQRPSIQFQPPASYTFPLDGGLDLVSSHPVKKPGKLIAGSNIEMVSGKQGYGRPGGNERCVDDTLPSETLVKFLEIKTPTGGAIAVDDLFTATGGISFRSLDAIATPAAGNIIAIATHNSTGLVADLICTGSTAGFTIDTEIIDLSAYSNSTLRAYRRQAIEQTRSNVPVVPGTAEINGGFRLRGKNYVFRDGALLRGDAGAWTAMAMPQVMYFDEGLSEFEVGDFITDGTATATIVSITLQGGAWNYSLPLIDQANGYLTLGDVSGVFTLDAAILVGETVPNISNGTFVSDTVWTKGVGWTIAAGVANSDGSQTAVSDLSQAFTLATGRTVSLTYDLTVSAGSITPFLGDTVGTAVTTAGAKSVTLERTAGSNIIGFRASADFVGTIDNVVRVVSIDTVPAIVMGDFSADTDWTKGTGWTIAAGKADCSGAQTTTSELKQSYTLAEGRSVKLTFTLSSVTSGTTQSITPFLGASNGDPISADGTYTITLTRTTGDAVIGFRASADFIGKVDDVSTAVGRRANVKTVNAAYTLPTGGSYKPILYNFTNVADNQSAYGVSGVGEAFEFDGTNYIPIFYPDFPTTFPFGISIHQERLQLHFPGGQFVYAVSGQPRVYNSLLGSGSYSTGSELIGAKKIHGNAQAIFSEDSIWLLLGTGIYNEDTATRDWQFVQHDSSIGAIAGSIAEKGPAIFVSGEEFRAVVSTDDSAGYASPPLLPEAKPLVAASAEDIVCSIWCREKAQHRLFLAAGKAIYSTFSDGKPKGETPISHPIAVKHVWSVVEDSVEKIWFTSTTDYLYRMDSGNSFDDQYIEGSFRIPFFHYGNNRRLKRFPQMLIEFDIPVLLTGDTEIFYTVNHAYGKQGYPRPTVDSLTEVDGVGGLYGSNAGFGSFVWGGAVVSEILGYLDGYGPNMSVLITYKTKYDNPFTFLSATVDYIELGLVRQET